MILKRVVEFAERELADTPTGYQPRFITKVIQLRTDGTLRDVIVPTMEQRQKRWGQERLEPQESPRRASQIKTRLFSDNVEYVLGKVGEKGNPAKIANRHSAWLDQIKKAVSSLDVPEVQAIGKWVETGGPDQLRDDPRIEDGDELTFEVQGTRPTALPAVRAFWANQSETEFTGQCLITGAFGPVLDRMPTMIKGVPGGQMSGGALVSVNVPSGESYGNIAALNSPFSPDAAEKLCNGLNHLINDHVLVKDEKGKERKKHIYSLRVGSTVFLGWGRPENVWDDLNDPDPEHVQQLIDQPRKGGDAPKVDEADFFVLSLSANAARIIVRDYHETTLATVKRNIGAWYKRLAIVGFDGKVVKPVSVYRLANSLFRDASKEMPDRVPTDLIGAAIRGSPLPEYLLGLAVRRNRAMQGPYSLTKANIRILDLSRLALIKAVLIPNAEEISLTHLEKEKAYNCGRLLATLESIHKLAIPGVNVTVADRYYGSASANPALVFGNLVKMAVTAHLPKLRRIKRGAYVVLDRNLQQIMAAIGDEYPLTLTLRSQGVFSLGYYYQRANEFAESKGNKELKEIAELASAEQEETTP